MRWYNTRMGLANGGKKTRGFVCHFRAQQIQCSYEDGLCKTKNKKTGNTQHATGCACRRNNRVNPLASCSHRRVIPRVLAVLLFGIAFQSQGSPQDRRWYESFYLYGVGSFFYTPRLFQELIEPRPGIRAAVGYELWRLHFALESGHTQVVGINPLVLNIELVPLVFRAGYTHPLFRGLGLRADLGFGTVFSEVVHYENAIGMLMGNLLTSRARTPVAGGRIFLVYTLPLNLMLHVGGGLDALFENDGPIPMPLVETGVSIRPLGFRPPRRPVAPVVDILALAMEAPAPVMDAPVPPPLRLVLAARFPPDMAVVIERYRFVMYEAGYLLRENPELRVVLRGHAAPFGDPGFLVALSRARAEYVRDFLVLRHGIGAYRITVEYPGVEGTPELADGSWESLRVVELVIRGAPPGGAGEPENR